MRKLIVANLVFGIAAILVGPASAGPITWGTPQNVSGDSDIATNGTFVDAVQSADTVTTRTIGDTVFSRVVPFGTNGASLSGNIFFVADANFTYTNTGVGSAAYQAVINQIAYSVPAATPTISLNNLVINQQYQVQVWAVQNGSAVNDTTFTSGNAVALTVDPAQYVIGTFTAAAATQTIAYTATTPGEHKLFTAIALRAIEVPEPNAITLACLGAIGLFRVTRRRTVA
jgi:hypothetical protein